MRANRELHESTARLAVVESGAALNGDDVDRGARKAHAAARDAVEFAEARVTGLEARLIQSAAALSEAKRVLAGEWTTWKNEQAEAVVARFEQAMDSFVRELKVVKAASAVLGHSGRLDEGVKNVALPPEVKSVIVAADNDINGTGLRAAREAADRFQREGRSARTTMPPEVGTDFNDLLQKESKSHV